MSHDHTDDATAIDALLAEMYEAWTDNDADRFVAHYAEDATALLPGSLRAGREDIRAQMAVAFDGPLKGTTTVDEQLSLRFVGEDCAISINRGAVVFPGESSAPDERTIHATWVFERRDGRWLVAAYHNSDAQVPVHA